MQQTSKWIMTILLTVCFSAATFAQYRLQGKVSDDNRQVLSGIVVSLRQDTALVGATITNTKGIYMFKNLGKGNYTITLSGIGYRPTEQQTEIKANKELHFTLMAEGEMQLDEVVVTADKSQVVRPKATGTSFYLSQHAKQCRNPYEALQEIPQLQIDPTNRKVTLANGTVPLILINGNRFNGGIDGIAPEDVEEIEIIEVPSARYLAEGVTALINFKVKRKEIVYHRFNAGMRHNVPALFGITNAYYETGNKDMSLNVSGQHWYFHNDDADWQRSQQNVSYIKQSDGNRRYSAQNYLIVLNADWVCSPKDYIAFNASYVNSPSSYTSDGNGVLQPIRREEGIFSYWNEEKTNYYINSYNCYYKHTFNKDCYWETIARFNLNGNETKGVRNEAYDAWQYDNLYDFDNFRYSGGLDTYLTFPWKKQNVEIGNRFSFVSDRIRQVTTDAPTFKHRNCNEYLYASLSGVVTPRLTYALSFGLNAIFRHAGDVDYDYYRPAGSLSLTYRIHTAHSLNISYMLLNETPEVGRLNPYNTSTDSLVQTKGNPFLLPSRNHQWKMRYIFTKNGFYVEPAVSYNLIQDEVENVGFTDNETGIYTSTYENTSRYSTLNAGLNMRYNSNKWGGIGIGIENLTYFFNGQSGKNRFKYNLNFYGWHKQWSWNGYMYYIPRDYRVNSVMKNRGAESEFTLAYKLSRSSSVNAGMRYWLGTLRQEQYLNQGSYSYHSRMKMRDRSYRFMAGFSYYIQSKKQPERRNKKTLNSTETGIKL